MPRRLAIAALCTTTLLAPAFAQGLPSPLPLPPAPAQPHESRPDCSEKGVKAMEEQLKSLEGLEKTAPETIALFCGGFDMLSGFMGWPDDEPIKGPLDDLARKLLHRSLTPRMVKAMCRQAAGEAGRNLKIEIGQLKDKLLVCKGV